jgi:hypothetical protein
VFATLYQPTQYRILALGHRVLLAAERSGDNPVATPQRDEGHAAMGARQLEWLVSNASVARRFSEAVMTSRSLST